MQSSDGPADKRDKGNKTDQSELSKINNLMSLIKYGVKIKLGEVGNNC